MNRTDYRDKLFPDCPIRNVLARIGDKWTLLVLYTLEQEPVMRFNTLQRALPDISQKMLTLTLRTLEEDGMVSRKVYADIMKYYIITALAICLGMVAYLDILKYLIHSSYWEGLVVVPIILASYLFQGIYFNLSFWYKLADRTIWGVYLSLLGCVVNCALLFLLVPRIGYVGAALASLSAYTVMMLVSYFLSQKNMPVDYDLHAIFKYVGLAAMLFAGMEIFKTRWFWVNILINTCLLAIFVVYLVRTDLPLSQIPLINKFVKRNKKQVS